jgi:hypothetical protein
LNYYFIYALYITNNKMTGCSSCDMGLGVPGTSGGGKRKYKRNHRMRGGAMPSLNPAPYPVDSFDRDGAALSKAAHNLYVKQNYELASIKNINAMAGGGKKKRSKTAKKYRSKSKSKQQRGGILELGSLVEAVVPFGLLAAQQRYKTRGTKGYKGRKSRKFRGSRRRR